MRNHFFASIITLLSTAGLVILVISGASAATYAFGVRAGDFLKYDTVSATFSSNVSSTPTPQFIKDFQATSFFRLDVQSISGSNATEKLTQSFNNGTVDKVQFVNWDIRTGQGNASSSQEFLGIGSFPLLVSGGLTTGDKICPGTTSNCAPTFNQTQTGTYAGASRNTNFISLTIKSFNFNSSITGNWDKPTGASVYFSVAISSIVPGPESGEDKRSYTIGLTATDTSLWSATVLGLSPLIFYGIIGAIVVIVTIIAVLMTMRMRKPKVAATPQPRELLQRELSDHPTGRVRSRVLVYSRGRPMVARGRLELPSAGS